MKQKSNWLKEAAASLLYLGVFALIRFILISQGANLRIGDEIIAVILLAVVVIIAVLIQISGSLRHFFSFTFDTLVLGMVGAFLWSLPGLSQIIVYIGLGIFVLFTVVAANKSINVFGKKGDSLGSHNEILEIHDFMSYCLGPKFILMAFGALLIEKILVPIIAG